LYVKAQEKCDKSLSKKFVTVQPSYSQKGEFEKIFSGSYPQKKRGTA
jgi:hypothetical protein